MAYLKPFLVAAAAFTVLDLLWLGIIARGVYEKYIGQHMRPSTDWTAALLFYLIFLAGVVYFVVQPGTHNNSTGVLLRGAFFGFVTYSTYELTNRAVLENWPWPIVLIDIAWGTVLCALVGWISWHFSQRP
ncbi:MAG: DUF2177 family protein [Phaeodactylibacter sp.]|uniref:DUF2177 family protein n=1 Tax=Phaeodactylibacter sp. TaxID=1940289 RepID=UPI0032EEA2AA